MGMIWRAMPLLSTLAALVIIAHSAEEGFEDERTRERDYRYELRPRVLHTETPTYDQPWRAIETEPMIHDKETPEDHQPYDEPVRRRRPRKRKRRPIPAPEEIPDKKTEDTDIYHEETRYREPEIPLSNDTEETRNRESEVHIHTDSDITEAPRRRRKRPNKDRPSRFTEEFFEFERPEKPLRRKNRRKRPSLDSPRLSEFDINHGEHTTEGFIDSEYLRVNYHYDNDNETNIPIEDYEHEDKKVDRLKVKSIPKRYFELRTEKTATASSSETSDGETLYIPLQEDKETLYRPLQEDKSLSEFSIEAEADTDEENPKNVQEVSKLREKLRDKSKLINNVDKALGSGPIDPVALKEILKRSNGTSLSEILQEHNLSLSDLLRGKEDAISVLKSKALENKVANNMDNTNIDNTSTPTLTKKDERKPKINIKSVTQIFQDKKAKYDKKQLETRSNDNETKISESIEDLEAKENGPRFSTTGSTKAKPNKNLPETTSTENDTKLPESEERLEAKENGPRLATIRRFPASMIPGNNRRKLRLRPSNNTMKNQLSRDLIAQTARKYLYHSGRNSTKGKDWKQVLPSMNLNLTQSADEANIETETTEIPIEIETAMQETTKMPVDEDDHDDDGEEDQDVQITTTEINVEIDTSDEKEPSELETEESTASNTTVVITTTTETTTTEKQKRHERPVLDEKKTGRKRQALNHRMKRKRLKQRPTTEAPEDDGLKDFLGMGNVVSSSEIIARTQIPDTPLPQNNDNDEDFTSLDDFLTTPISRKPVKTTRITTMTYSSPRRNYEQSTTEETAKFEIEEILNDTRTSARLSKILMEINMTLNELVEHRERGSSHVHLADIFHNASKEPNPPEPFLSKSSIEPISKETYPLRAILEANLHDSAAKATTLDTNLAPYIHIPVVMDFGNNVNENGENMGIMSLFNKIATESHESVENSDVKKDSEGTPYITTIISLNATDLKAKTNESAREGKDVKEPDVTGWNKLLELMRKHHENSTEDVLKSITTDETSSESTKPGIDDPDGEGLIVLEDLQRLDAFKSNIALESDDNMDVNTYQSDTTVQPGILDRLPSNTRSVTVATASIVGLAMILFLLTYAAFKWKQQRSLLRKKESFSEERIPTPVFESRKGHKNNCSTRSISPMLASNIYTMNTLDSRAGTESPEYMWDSLRKPFQ